MSQRSAIRKVSTLLTLSLFASLAQAEDSSGLELRAYVDQPGWSHIVEGSYAEAAEVIEARLRSVDLIEQIAAYNNLCVARTMLRELEAASAACNSAVNRAKIYERRYGNHDRSATSTALSNRGVLHILMGDAENAIADLERASASNNEIWMTPERNLAFVRN